jgi:hypothetical protein
MIIRTPPKITNKSSLLKYIEIDLWSWLKDLSIGILKMDFLQNFQSFAVNNLVIPANTEVAISNAFNTSYPGVIPTTRIITRQQGDANIIDGDNVWTSKTVFLKNPSSNDATISVIFFK